jgi:hypothetical protein
MRASNLILFLALAGCCTAAPRPLTITVERSNGKEVITISVPQGEPAQGGIVSMISGALDILTGGFGIYGMVEAADN